jgi:hypothetical protein
VRYKSVLSNKKVKGDGSGEIKIRDIKKSSKQEHYSACKLFHLRNNYILAVSTL